MQHQHFFFQLTQQKINYQIFFITQPFVYSSDVKHVFLLLIKKIYIDRLFFKVKSWSI